jgi:hypothetical protein
LKKRKKEKEKFVHDGFDDDGDHNDNAWSVVVDWIVLFSVENIENQSFFEILLYHDVIVYDIARYAYTTLLAYIRFYFLLHALCNTLFYAE